MKNKVFILISAVLCISLFCSCTEIINNGMNVDTATVASKETVSETTQNGMNVDTATVASKETVSETIQSDIKADENLLPEEFPLDFEFASGAGAWGTSITLNRDGTFKGIYHDSEMGLSGDEYPNGTVYVSVFEGSFIDIKKIDDCTYSMVLSDVTTENEKDEEWISDKIRYVATEPFGIESGKEFILYTPEKKIDGLSEEFLSYWPYNFPFEERKETLSCYGIENKEMGYGFFNSEYNSIIID